MTPEQFYAETLGKVIDYDGAYGAQCVDAFRYWGTMNSVPVPPTPNNYADGYWYSRDALGFDKWFAYINNPAEFRTGDWVIWGRSTMPGGSKSHKSSHIAMYYMGKEYGENQGGNGGFTLKDTVFSDALGALRWKGYIMDDKTIEQLAYEVIAGMWGNGEERKERLTRAGYDYNAIQAKVDEIMAFNQTDEPEPTPEPTPEPSEPEPAPVEPEPTPDPEPETPETEPEKPSGWSNEFFDIMRYLAEVGLPALSALVAAIGKILGYDQAATIAAIIMAISTFVGSLVHQKRKEYNNNGGE